MAHLNGLGCEIWLILRDERSLKKTFKEEHVNTRDIISYLLKHVQRGVFLSFFYDL